MAENGNNSIEALADQYVRRIGEWDDRTSPEDWPEAMLITGEELKRELLLFAREAAASALPFPLELTPDLSEVLGMPNFRAGSIARAFREAGRADIKPRSEDEQAFVLHWLTTLVLEHGAEWRKRAGETLTVVIAEANAAREAREAAAAEQGDARG